MWRRKNKAFGRAWGLGGTAILIVFLSACAHAPAAKPAGVLSPDRTPGTLTVAVLPFEDNSIAASAGTAGLGRSLADGIALRLSRQPGLVLIDRESIDKVLEELALSSGGLAGAEGRLRLGKLLGAHYLVMGGYMAIGPALRVDARLIEVERGLTEGRAVEGTLADRGHIETALSDKVSKLVLAQLGAAPLKDPMSSADHLRVGLALEKQQQFDEALKHYQRALAIDSDNREARNRMEALLLKEIE